MKFKSTGTQVIAAITVLATITGLYAFLQTTTAARYRCWDGSRTAKISECPPPTGRSGLAWVFPSLEPKTGCEFTRPVKSQKTAVYVCPFRTGGGQGLVRYTAWTDLDSAREYYRTQYGRKPSVQVLDDEGIGHEWATETYQSPRGLRFKRSGSSYGAAFSWSVEASSRSALEHGRSALDIRAVKHWAYDRELGFWDRLRNGLSV